MWIILNISTKSLSRYDGIDLSWDNTIAAIVKLILWRFHLLSECQICSLPIFKSEFVWLSLVSLVFLTKVTVLEGKLGRIIKWLVDSGLKVNESKTALYLTVMKWTVGPFPDPFGERPVLCMGCPGWWIGFLTQNLWNINLMILIQCYYLVSSFSFKLNI